MKEISTGSVIGGYRVVRALGQGSADEAQAFEWFRQMCDALANFGRRSFGRFVASGQTLPFILLSCSCSCSM